MENHTPVKVEALDLVRRMGAYDGREPDDYNAKVKVPMGLPYMEFSFAEISKNKFADLENILGKSCFGEIVNKMGYKVPNGPFETWRGDDGLALTYYVREGDKPATKELILTGFGEFQPGRYRINIEGFWRVTNARF